MNLEELLVIIPSERPSEIERENWKAATEAGRTARLCDLPVTKCPPFKDNDLVLSWKMGWRHEDERIAARKAQRSTGETLKCPACGTTLTMTDGFRPKK